MALQYPRDGPLGGGGPFWQQPRELATTELSLEKQLKNQFYVIVITLGVPEGRDVGVGEALVDDLALSVVRRAREECVVVR